MTSLFVFGTLRDHDLLRIVIGREVATEPASLAGHKVTTVAGEDFPICLPRSGSTAEGLLVSGLSDSEIVRLDFYETGFGYSRAQYGISVAEKTVTAEMYAPDGEVLQPSDAPWSLEAWQAEYGDLTREAAVEAMTLVGRISACELPQRWPVLAARAQTRLTARLATHPRRDGLPDLGDLEVIRMSVPYDEFFRLEEHHIRFPRFAGGLSAPVERVALVSVDAVTVLPYDPVRDRVLLVDQFRAGAYARGDQQPWTLEPVAGRVDGGESWEDTAHREAFEEAGLRLRGLEFIGGYYPSPGVLSEYLASYIGICDLPDVSPGLYGVEGEGEDIRTLLCPFGELMEMTRDGRVQNGPLFLSALWLASQRDRLRGGD
ncbi:MAG: gamma-glutamylcyclotransferase [Dinoroseobacter sp.]|nr:gamma-glutamylcyclotransferase [Dinoroseobacter sp.]